MPLPLFKELQLVKLDQIRQFPGDSEVVNFQSEHKTSIEHGVCGIKIMHGAYASMVEENITRIDLPNIKDVD